MSGRSGRGPSPGRGRGRFSSPSGRAGGLQRTGRGQAGFVPLQQAPPPPPVDAAPPIGPGLPPAVPPRQGAGTQQHLQQPTGQPSATATDSSKAGLATSAEPASAAADASRQGDSGGQAGTAPQEAGREAADHEARPTTPITSPGSSGTRAKPPMIMKNTNLHVANMLKLRGGRITPSKASSAAKPSAPQPVTMADKSTIQKILDNMNVADMERSTTPSNVPSRTATPPTLAASATPPPPDLPQAGMRSRDAARSPSRVVALSPSQHVPSRPDSRKDSSPRDGDTARPGTSRRTSGRRSRWGRDDPEGKQAGSQRAIPTPSPPLTSDLSGQAGTAAAALKTTSAADAGTSQHPEAASSRDKHLKDSPRRPRGSAQQASPLRKADGHRDVQQRPSNTSPRRPESRLGAPPKSDSSRKGVQDACRTVKQMAEQWWVAQMGTVSAPIVTIPIIPRRTGLSKTHFNHAWTQLGAVIEQISTLRMTSGTVQQTETDAMLIPLTV
ncbi:hypothetical protein WJX84_002809 [Apatococcus fuscideae]|uniref:Uncharacterized protein n=1 Tax=Apatococcus fuscideae TaxID=2026836 RepID=A0AAW1TC57_9CHLO